MGAVGLDAAFFYYEHYFGCSDAVRTYIFPNASRETSVNREFQGLVTTT